MGADTVGLTAHTIGAIGIPTKAASWSWSASTGPVYQHVKPGSRTHRQGPTEDGRRPPVTQPRSSVWNHSPSMGEPQSQHTNGTKSTAAGYGETVC